MKEIWMSLSNKYPKKHIHPTLVILFWTKTPLDVKPSIYLVEAKIWKTCPTMLTQTTFSEC